MLTFMFPKFIQVGFTYLGRLIYRGLVNRILWYTLNLKKYGVKTYNCALLLDPHALFYNTAHMPLFSRIHLVMISIHKKRTGKPTIYEQLRLKLKAIKIEYS